MSNLDIRTGQSGLIMTSFITHVDRGKIICIFMVSEVIEFSEKLVNECNYIIQKFFIVLLKICQNINVR